MLMAKENMPCPLGALTLGLVPAEEKFLDGSFTIPSWLKSQEVRAPKKLTVWKRAWRGLFLSYALDVMHRQAEAKTPDPKSRRCLSQHCLDIINNST
jgi:hypothetical protein